MSCTYSTAELRRIAHETTDAAERQTALDLLDARGDLAPDTMEERHGATAQELAQ